MLEEMNKMWKIVNGVVYESFDWIRIVYSLKWKNFTRFHKLNGLHLEEMRRNVF